MKIGIYKFTVHLSSRSIVNGVANAAEIYAKKLMFGEDSIKEGDLVRVVDVDPVEEAERLRRVMPLDLHEKMLGTFSDDWKTNMKKFTYKKTDAAKTDAAKTDDSAE